MSNPLLSSNFDAKCRENLVLSSWVDSSLLTGVNTEEEVVKRGFVLGSQGDKTGIVVSVGSLKNSVKTKVPSTSTKIVRKALFCKVGVGRSFVAESATIDSKEIPDGYNSLYIYGIHN